ncbi:MAG TPA: asparagine synthase (glutamine-hydrolyzing) [Solirubrobacteraceae bacterium]|nr:asparagine synthase (glutamine-hydrolyzing) [Solirubrobacteraceae bacterium]
MCGIAGLMNRDGRPADPAAVQAITAVLAHRGPDGEGVHVDGCVGLGHRRLAILDLSDAGRQPLPCVDGRYWVTFNGEIYNFVELRRELESHGYRFRTQTDTEVIGVAYDFWGADCVLRFNGMWAFAIWDSTDKELFLSRDRFGIKPLFYLLTPARFAFASELKSFLCLEDFEPRQNSKMTWVALFRPGRFEMLDETLLEGVRQLHGGHSMLVTKERSRTWRWWRTLDHVPPAASTLKAQAEEYRELFFDSCRLRLRSDVPIATCLSGGIDSSAVICTLAALHSELDSKGRAERISPDYQRAFVATYPGTYKDESRYAQLAIERSGATPRYREMDPSEAVTTLEQFTYDFENIGISLLFPLWSIYRELRRDGVAVSLDGHGGDELFAGYSQHVSEALRWTNLFRSPARTWDLVDTLKALDESHGPSRAGLVIDQAKAALRSKPGGAAGTLHPQWSRGPFAIDEELQLDDAEERQIDSLDPLNAFLYRAVHQNALPNLLRNFDRCSMAHGVEIRMPFMDWRLVCYAFAVPDTSKLGGGFTKRIVREAMRGVMPEPLLARRDKIGFMPPLREWFAGGLGEVAWDAVQRPEFVESEIWDGPAIRDFVEARHRANNWGPGDSLRVWPFVQAELWRGIFLERTPLAPSASSG